LRENLAMFWYILLVAALNFAVGFGIAVQLSRA
jgi:hypothetical protein